MRSRGRSTRASWFRCASGKKVAARVSTRAHPYDTAHSLEQSGKHTFDASNRSKACLTYERPKHPRPLRSSSIMNTKHGSFWYVGANALVVLSVAAGLTVATGAAAKADSSATVLSSRQSLAAGQAVTLVISGDLGGDVHVIGSGGNDVSPTAKPKGTLADRVELTTARDPQALRINLDLRSGSSSWRTWMHWHNTNVEVVMRVPRKAAVAVTNINGPVLVDDATGRLTVRVV